MKGAQQFIKTLAIVFAVFLVCGIGAVIVGTGTLVGYIFGGISGAGDSSQWSEDVIGDQLGFDELRIKVAATNVRVEQGDKFQILADEEAIEYRRDGNKIYLEEKDFGLWGNWHKIGGELKIVLPEEMMSLKKMSLEAGAGTVYISGLVAEEMDLDLGAGRAELTGVKVANQIKVDGGAGYLVMTGAELRNLDLEMGVGKVELAGKIEGSSKIDAGVGKLEVRLQGKEDDYRLKFEKGLGVITVNGESMGDGAVWGNGVNKIEVDGGVGAIEIVVEEE